MTFPKGKNLYHVLDRFSKPEDHLASKGGNFTSDRKGDPHGDQVDHHEGQE